MKAYSVFIMVILLYIYSSPLLSQSAPTTTQDYIAPDSCLTLICPNDIVNYNPDHIMIDTCKNSPTYGDWYQRGRWTIGFKKYFFKDSTNIVSRGNKAQLKDIDSANFPEIYIAYKTLAEKFGEITFQRDFFACKHYSDSAYYSEPCLNISFDKLNRSKDVEYYLNQLPDITFVSQTNYPVKSNVPASCLTLIWPNDGDNYNPDYIRIDTCKDSPTYGQYYQFGTWSIRFDKYFLKDSIPAGGGAWINDVDSVNFKVYYDSLKSLQLKYGKWNLWRDPDICGGFSDYMFYKNLCYDIWFDKVNLANSVLRDLYKLPGVIGVILRNFPSKSSVYEAKVDDCIQLEENAKDLLTIKLCETLKGLNTNIIIFDLLGQLVNKIEDTNRTDLINIDIHSLTNGIYFIYINNKIFKFSIIR